MIRPNALPATVGVILALGLSAEQAHNPAESYAQDDTFALDCPEGQHTETIKTVESTTLRCVDDNAPDPGLSDNTPRPHHPKSTPGNTVRDFYRNPLRSVDNLVPKRIDMGVDYSGHGPVYALGKGVVTVATNHSRYWANHGATAVVYKLSNGPAKGESVFFTENCKPRVRVGQRVTPKTVICNMNGGVETGWAMKRGSNKDWPAAHYVYHQYPNGSKTAQGLNFSRLMRKLGAPAGNSNPKYVSTNQGKVVGSSSSLPQWHRMK